VGSKEPLGRGAEQTFELQNDDWQVRSMPFAHGPTPLGDTQIEPAEQMLLRHSGSAPCVHGPFPAVKPHSPSASQTLTRHFASGPVLFAPSQPSSSLKKQPSLPVTQGPSPFAYPHLLSITSHTPLKHTRAPLTGLQI
jgi:hypothetical protein